MNLTPALWQPLWLSVKLALSATLVLMALALPLAWWLSGAQRGLPGRMKPLVEALVALPLVLPPTVLGFYLMLWMGPRGFLGRGWSTLTGEPLAFTFSGLVIASVLFSLPFAVQPLQAAFETVGRTTLEAARTLGAGPLDAFFTVMAPQAFRGVLAAAVLGFAHTLGEFGVVLMVGGNIPGETQVISIAIYNQVEAMDYPQAHTLSALLLAFSMAVLLLVYSLNGRWRKPLP